MKLELRAISKRFPGVVANDRVDLTVESGQIHGLLGENGAGKTTLVNVLYGLYEPDDGEILLDGATVTRGHGRGGFEGPAQAIAAGIGMVHQHFMLVPVFTVAENVLLGVERTGPLGLLDRARARREVGDLSSRYGLPVDPTAVVEDLPVGVQQRVEILKALARDARLLILDEPTAVLTPPEVDDLFTAMRSLADAGTSIVFITHKLKEVRRICDRITVLRDGRVVGSTGPEASEQELATMMVGRPVELQVRRAPPSPGDVVLSVEDLVVLDERGQVAVDGVALDVRSGEILAIAGVEGNGQTELVRALSGLTPAATGTIRLRGRDLSGLDRRSVLEAGVGHVPEDRSRDGLVGGFSVAENLVLDQYHGAPFSRAAVIDWDAVRDRARALIEDFDIRTPGPAVAVSTLSGGNQQKVVVAREFARSTPLLIASQPTRGLDVGSIEYIHRRLIQRRDEGAAVVIVSSELDEVMALGDRVGVMFRGRLSGPFPAPVDRERVGLLMAGAAPEEG